jgi:N-dimethylarginine dimethylaminohydrolase
LQVRHSQLAPRASTLKRQAHFLMCPPNHFAVSYSINPWMDPDRWTAEAAVLTETAARQWHGLYRELLGSGADIELVRAMPDLPDLVFTANGAVILDRKVLLARFRHPERRPEEAVFARAAHELKCQGAIDTIEELPAGLVLEGAGDCIWDPNRNQFWLGFGQRSDASARAVVAGFFGVDCVALELADPRFYHLDTAFSALPCGEIVYHPPAFARASRRAIEDRVHPQQQIILDEDDAEMFAANLVAFGRHILLSGCSEKLRRGLEERGYTVLETPLDAFQRSGGSACCLTLRIDHASLPAHQRVRAAAISG